MATTFDVFYLGTGPLIDQTEGDAVSENATALLGNTYGSSGDALADYIRSFSPGSTGFSSGDATAYDTNNSAANDTFRIDGGPDQTFDGLAVYNATLTYNDGTTASITAVVIQDTGGNLYLLPEVSNNADQAALEALPIRSVTLDSLVTDFSNATANRYDANFAVCFTAGTAIRTPQGDRLIDSLRVGDMVCTMDNGPQPIRWIGRKHLNNNALLIKPHLRPVLIRRGVLGVERDLFVSPQHGMLLGPDQLVRAKHLAEAPKSRIRIARGKREVTYIHLMFDAHQIVFAEGAPSESFYPGPMAQRMLDRQALAEMRALFPDLTVAQPDLEAVSRAYGTTARAFTQRRAVARRIASCHPAIAAGCLT